MVLKSNAKFEEKPICCFKMTRIWWILIRALKSLKTLHFNWCLLCKIYNVWPRKYKGVIFYRTKESWKIWRKIDLWFRKWHEKFGKFSSEHVEVSKLGLWWHPFVQSRKFMRLRFTGKLWVMKMKNDTKFEEELTCQFKVWLKELD